MYVNNQRYIIKVAHIGGIQYIGQGGATSPDRAHVQPMSFAQLNNTVKYLRGLPYEVIKL